MGASSTWYYPGYWYAYSYTTGTVVLGMIDGRPQAAGQQVPLVWSAGVNGVLDGQAANITIATAGINQAFQQSPYLSEEYHNDLVRRRTERGPRGRCGE